MQLSEGMARGCGTWSREWSWCREHSPAAWHREQPWGVRQGVQGGMVHGCVSGGCWDMVQGAATVRETPLALITWRVEWPSGVMHGLWRGMVCERRAWHGGHSTGVCRLPASCSHKQWPWGVVRSALAGGWHVATGHDTGSSRSVGGTCWLCLHGAGSSPGVLCRVHRVASCSCMGGDGAWPWGMVQAAALECSTGHTGGAGIGGVARCHGAQHGEQPWGGEHLLPVDTWGGEQPQGVTWGMQGGMVHGYVDGVMHGCAV